MYFVLRLILFGLIFHEMDDALLISQLRLKDRYLIAEVFYPLGHNSVIGGDVEVATSRLAVVGGFYAHIKGICIQIKKIKIECLSILHQSQGINTFSLQYTIYVLF